jgi:hypothetical protein
MPSVERLVEPHGASATGTAVASAWTADRGSAMVTVTGSSAGGPDVIAS